MVVDAVTGVMTLTPEQLRPVLEFNAGIDADQPLVIGAIDRRTLIPVDIEQLTREPDMEPAEPT